MQAHKDVGAKNVIECLLLAVNGWPYEKKNVGLMSMYSVLSDVMDHLLAADNKIDISIRHVMTTELAL